MRIGNYEFLYRFFSFLKGMKMNKGILKIMRVVRINGIVLMFFKFFSINFDEW